MGDDLTPGLWIVRALKSRDFFESKKSKSLLTELVGEEIDELAGVGEIRISFPLSSLAHFNKGACGDRPGRESELQRTMGGGTRGRLGTSWSETGSIG